MKALKLTLVLLFAAITCLVGQNYQTVRSGRISYFENDRKEITCIRIDSSKYQADSILYPFTVFQETDIACFSPDIASWIGCKVVLSETGNNYFFNRNNDSILIKTNAKPGEEWVLWQNDASYLVKARVTKHDTMSFLGLTDSVKTISLEAYNQNMEPVSLGLEGKNLQISKHFGWVKTLNFYLFPNLHGYSFGDFLNEHQLVGLSAPEAGLQNLTWMEVFDFQEGDEFHVLYESGCWDSEYGTSVTDKAIYRYLERNSYDDSIVYRYSRKQRILTEQTDSSWLTLYDDTLQLTIRPNAAFDLLPGEPVRVHPDEYHNGGCFMNRNEPFSKSIQPVFEFYNDNNGSCWQLLHFDGCMPSMQYTKGLGGPYYSCENAFCFGGESRKLVYYQKGEESWGEKLVLTSLDELKRSSLVLYPNPARDYIEISFNDAPASAFDLLIYNFQGQALHSESMDGTFTRIDVSTLQAGSYLLKITGEKGKVLATKKFVIE